MRPRANVGLSSTISTVATSPGAPPSTNTVLPSGRCPTAADPKLMRSMGTTSPDAPAAHGAEAAAAATPKAGAP